MPIAGCYNACGHGFDVDYENVGDKHCCPKCGTEQIVDYVETYEPDTGACYEFWYMTPQDRE